MDTTPYKARLQAEEQRLLAHLEREAALARQPGDDAVHDLGDASVTDVEKEDHFHEAETDASVLTQVRDALQRIADGTFGKCLEDGEAIEEKRLEAVPWTRYCLRHQQLREIATRTRTPTL